MAINNKVKSTNDLELKDRLVAINRVTKVTKGGRTFSFAAIVVVGNEDGIVGHQPRNEGYERRAHFQLCGDCSGRKRRRHRRMGSGQSR